MSKEMLHWSDRISGRSGIKSDSWRAVSRATLGGEAFYRLLREQPADAAGCSRFI